jgi:archaellum biogenesis protein FlaJ (TadC family)
MESVTEFFTSIGLRSVALGVTIFLVTFLANLGLVSLILVKIPADYFKKSRRSKFMANHSQAIRVLVMVGKNLLGVVLVILGILLSLPGVPGQGVLTILLGIMLLDFPGRRRFEQWIVSSPRVKNAINKLRQRFDKPALELD